MGGALFLLIANYIPETKQGSECCWWSTIVTATCHLSLVIDPLLARHWRAERKRKVQSNGFSKDFDAKILVNFVAFIFPKSHQSFVMKTRLKPKPSWDLSSNFRLLGFCWLFGNGLEVQSRAGVDWYVRPHMGRFCRGYAGLFVLLLLF